MSSMQNEPRRLLQTRINLRRNGLHQCSTTFAVVKTFTDTCHTMSKTNSDQNFACVNLLLSQTIFQISNVKQLSHSNFIPNKMLKQIVLAAFLGLAFYQQVSTACKCGQRSSTRIVDGTQAPEGHYPWIVAVRHFVVLKNLSITVGNCGGSIVNSEWILTGAHCFRPPGANPDAKNVLSEITYVAVGTNNITRMSPYHLLKPVEDENGNVNFVDTNRVPEAYKVDQVVLHESYDPSTMENDIALIHLSRPVTFSPRVSPVCLESIVENYPEMEAAGWGNIGYKIKGGPLLNHVDLNEIPAWQCKLHWPDIDENRQVCFRNEMKGTCKGDSGGPVTVNRASTHYQIAVISFGPIRCDDYGIPNVGTRVSAFRNWILSKATTGVWCQ